jgi:integrating conjugative element protein (TIGR03761 family)
MSLQFHAHAAESLSDDVADDVLLDGHPESRVYIELRTDAAYRLVIGRPRTEHKPAINGLLSFASLLRDIWDAAKSGDPYARWWLVKVEVALGKAETTLEPALISVHKTLSASLPLQVDHSRGRPPRRLDLMFACPYAYYAARLLKQLDLLITQLDTGVQIGILRKAETTNSRLRCERAMRRAFTASQGFWNFGITNELVQCRDPKAVDAEAKMGVLPDEILTGECWPMLLDEYAVTPIDRSDSDEA